MALVRSSSASSTKSHTRDYSPRGHTLRGFETRFFDERVNHDRAACSKILFQLLLEAYASDFRVTSSSNTNTEEISFSYSRYYSLTDQKFLLHYSFSRARLLVNNSLVSLHTCLAAFSKPLGDLPLNRSRFGKK